MASAEFTARVAEWQSFYAVLAGGSATFAGLLFVSLSVNPGILAKEHEAALRLARHTFGCFIYLVLIALVVMIPRQVPFGLGLPLFGMGLGALIQTIRASRESGRDPSALRLVRERSLYRLSMATYAILMVVAVALLLGKVLALYALVSLMIWQLAWASRLAWDLLLFRE